MDDTTQFVATHWDEIQESITPAMVLECLSDQCSGGGLIAELVWEMEEAHERAKVAQFDLEHDQRCERAALMRGLGGRWEVNGR